MENVSQRELKRTLMVGCILDFITELKPYFKYIQQNDRNQIERLTQFENEHCAYIKSIYNTLIDLELLNRILKELKDYILEYNAKYANERSVICIEKYINCIHNNHAYPEQVVYKLKK